MKKDNELKLVKIDSEYCNYLRGYDSRVPYNFKNKKTRPFVGVLFQIDDIKYFAPLSSPKPKHLKMTNTIDFLRLDSGKLGAINFNNMIPVMDNNVIIINLNEIQDTIINNQYQSLLKEQIFWLNRNKKQVYFMAKNLYSSYIKDNLKYKIKDRCCNFKLLEQKCNEYNLQTIV